MTIYIHNVRRARVHEEANGSFGVDLSATGAFTGFKDLPFVEGSMTAALNLPYETPGHSEQKLDGYPVKVAMVKTAKLDFTINLETLTTKATTGVTAAQSALGMLLKIAMGGEQLGTGTTITTGASATSLPCVSAAGIAVGSAIACATGAGGSLEVREVASKSSNTLTLKHALSGAPADSSAVLSGATYYLGGTDGSQTTSLQAYVEGLAPNDRALLLGGWLESMALELGPGTIPRVKFSYMFADWQWPYSHGATLALATYADAVTVVQKDSYLLQQVVGTTTFNAASVVHAPEIAFTPRIKYALHKTPAGVNTVKQPIRDRSVPVLQVGFTVPYEDTTWQDHRDARDAMAIYYQIGSVASVGGPTLSAPTVQVDDVQIVNKDSITSTKVGCSARLDTGTSGSSADLALSAFRVHLI